MTDDPMALIEQLYEPINCLAWLSAGDEIESDDILQIDEIAELVDQLWQCLRERQVSADLDQLDTPTSRHLARRRRDVRQI